MRVDASTMGASLPAEEFTRRGGAHHIRDFLKVAYTFSQVIKRPRGNLVRRPSITTPHSRISKRRRGVSPGRQLHEGEFGALPLTSVPKHATPSSRPGFLSHPPTRIASFGTGTSRWDTRFPLRPPSNWAFPKPGCQNPGIWCAHPLPRHQIPEFRKGPQRFPSSPNPQIGMWCQGPGPSAHTPLTAPALGGCPCR